MQLGLRNAYTVKGVFLLLSCAASRGLPREVRTWMPEGWSGNLKPWQALITARYKSEPCQLSYVHKASPRGIFCGCFWWGSAGREPPAVPPRAEPLIALEAAEPRSAPGAVALSPSLRPLRSATLAPGRSRLLPAAAGARWLRARLHSPEHRSGPRTPPPPPLPPPPRRRAAAARAQDPPPPRAGGGRADGRGRARRAARSAAAGRYRG